MCAVQPRWITYRSLRQVSSLVRSIGAAGLLGYLSLAASPTSAQPEQSQDDSPATGPQNTSAQDTVGWGSTGGGASADDTAGWGAAPGTATNAANAVVTPEAPAKLRARGRLRLRNGYWTRQLTDHPLAQARAMFELESSYGDSFDVEHIPSKLRLMGGFRGEYDAVYALERERYDQAARDTYEHRLYWLQTYAELTIGQVAISFGKQLAPLGQGEVFSMLDLVNPRDLREPALTDLADMRLPVTMSRLSLLLGALTIEAMLVFEANAGMLPPPLGRLSPFRKLIVNNALSGEQLGSKTWFMTNVPSGWHSGPDQWQYVGRLAYAGSGYDLEVVAASLFDRYGVPRLPQPAAFAQPALTLELYHPREVLLGMSGNWALGDFLLRGELAAELDKPQAALQPGSELLRIEGIRQSQIGGLLGLTYFGVPGGNIGLEVQKTWAIEQTRRDLSLLWPVEALSGALRWMQNLAGETLQLNLLTAVVGLDHFNSAFVRAELALNPGAGVSVYATFVKYFGSRSFGPFYGFENNDRAQLTLRWDFILL